MVGDSTRVAPALGATVHPFGSAEESWLESLFPVDVVVDLHPHPLVVCKFATGSRMCRKCNRIVYARGRRCTRPECAPVPSPRTRSQHNGTSSGSPLTLTSPLHPHSSLRGLNSATGMSQRRGSTIDAAVLAHGTGGGTPPIGNASNGSFAVSKDLSLLQGSTRGRIANPQQQSPPPLSSSGSTAIPAQSGGRSGTPQQHQQQQADTSSAFSAVSSGIFRQTPTTTPNRNGSVGRGGRPTSTSPNGAAGGRGKSPRAAAATAARGGALLGGLDMFFCDACFDAGRRFQQLCLASCAGGPRAALAIAALEGVRPAVQPQEPLPVGPEGGRPLSAVAVMAAAAAAAASSSRRSSRSGTPTGVLGRRASEFATRVRSASVAAAAAAVGGVSGATPASNLSMAATMSANVTGNALILTVPPLPREVLGGDGATADCGAALTAGGGFGANFSFGSPPQLQLAGLLSPQSGAGIHGGGGGGKGSASPGHMIGAATPASARSNDSSGRGNNTRAVPAFSFGTTPRGLPSARGRTDAGHDFNPPFLSAEGPNGPALLNQNGGAGGPDLTSEALLDAAAAGATTRVRELLDLTKFLRTVDIEDTTTVGPHRGKTALILGAEHGHHGVVALLLERGAVSESVDARGMTPLMLASYNGHLAAVETLIAHGAVQHRAALCGYTALHFACTRGHDMVVHRLVCADAPINARTPSGRTPLIIAALNGHTQTVATLLRRSDCDVAARDHEGYSALDAAVARGHRAAEVVLLEAMQRQ